MGMKTFSINDPLALPKGTRVKLSAMGKQEFPNSPQYGRGVIVRGPKDKVVRVLWNGMRNPQSWHFDYIDPINPNRDKRRKPA